MKKSIVMNLGLKFKLKSDIINNWNFLTVGGIAWYIVSAKIVEYFYLKDYLPFIIHYNIKNT